MRTVWKYAIPVEGLTVELYEPHVVLVAQDPAGGHGPTIWIEHNTAPDPLGLSPTPRHYRVVGTGHELSSGGKHVGSCVCRPFVWHVYEDDPR